MRTIKFRVYDKSLGRYLKEGDWMGHYDDLYYDDLQKLLSDDGYIFQQFTGLKDKNGKEIYEGDILQDEYGNNAVVEWRSASGGYELNPTYSIWWRGLRNDLNVIIGNIYETPQLLPELFFVDQE